MVLLFTWLDWRGGCRRCLLTYNKVMEEAVCVCLFVVGVLFFLVVLRSSLGVGSIGVDVRQIWLFILYSD